MTCTEIFEKYSISSKFKEGENIALAVAPYGLKKCTSFQNLSLTQAL